MTKFLKKCIIILLVVFSIVCRTALPAIPLFDEYGNLTDGSKEICSILRISKEVTDAETFYEYFRDNIYRSRPFVGARYSYCPYVSKLDENSFNRLLDACGKLQMTNEILPKKEHYDYVVVFGSSTEIMKMYCSFMHRELCKIFEKNPNIKVYILAGHRNLDAAIDSQEIIDKLSADGLPCTELYAAKEIFENEARTCPSCHKLDVKYIFLNVEKDEIPDDERIMRLAGYRDKMQKLLQTEKLKPGSMLCVSCNPSIYHEYNVHLNMLRSYGWEFGGGTFETAGPCFDIRSQAEIFGEKPVAQLLLNKISECAYYEYNLIKNHSLE